jgi:hypothetical protein
VFFSSPSTRLTPAGACSPPKSAADAAPAHLRVDRVACVPLEARAAPVMKRIAARLPRIPDVFADPALSVAIDEIKDGGAVPAAHPFSHRDHRREICLDGTSIIARTRTPGRCSSTPTRRSTTSAVKRATRCRRCASPCATRPESAPPHTEKKSAEAQSASADSPGLLDATPARPASVGFRYLQWPFARPLPGLFRLQLPW